MNTIVTFGVKYKTQKQVSIETGFWLWKKQKQHWVDNIRTANYSKEQYIPSYITQVELPIFGAQKIKERTARSDHVEIWMGNMGFRLGGNFDFEYLTEKEFQEHDLIIKAEGFHRRSP